MIPSRPGLPVGTTLSDARAGDAGRSSLLHSTFPYMGPKDTLLKRVDSGPERLTAVSTASEPDGTDTRINEREVKRTVKPCGRVDLDPATVLLSVPAPSLFFPTASAVYACGLV